MVELIFVLVLAVMAYFGLRSNPDGSDGETASADGGSSDVEGSSDSGGGDGGGGGD